MPAQMMANGDVFPHFCLKSVASKQYYNDAMFVGLTVFLLATGFSITPQIRMHRKSRMMNSYPERLFRHLGTRIHLSA